MFITKKRHEAILQKVMEDHKKELAEARELTSVLQILAEKTGIPTPSKDKGHLFLRGDSFLGASWDSLSIDDSVAQYVDDYLGGKVIKQEATKLIVIESDGKVSEHLTKEHPDQGREYKLIQK